MTGLNGASAKKIAEALFSAFADIPKPAGWNSIFPDGEISADFDEMHSLLCRLTNDYSDYALPRVLVKAIQNPGPDWDLDMLVIHLDSMEPIVDDDSEDSLPLKVWSKGRWTHYGIEKCTAILGWLSHVGKIDPDVRQHSDFASCRQAWGKRIEVLKSRLS